MIKKNKKVFLLIVLLLFTIAISSIIAWAIRSTPTISVSSVIIKSDDYDKPGSWRIQKSASWIAENKAKITINLQTIPKINNHQKDIIFVIDNSASLDNDNLIKIKNDLKRIINYILNDSNNNISLITFNSSSEILSNFTNNVESLNEIIDGIEAIGETNYNEALVNVINVLKNYEFTNNRDVRVVFFTDGRPTLNNPEQIVTSEIIKDNYPSLKINSIQYNMHSPIITELKQISDEQFSADDLGIYTAFLKASVEPYSYDSFVINDYIDSNYFEIDSESNIQASIGSTSITVEGGKEKITWNLEDSFITGDKASLEIIVKLKNEYQNISGLYSTNDHVIISHKLKDENLITKDSDKTPILKNFYTVSYDNNLPDGCAISKIADENHPVYTNVTVKQENLVCDGYNFEGFKIIDNDVKTIGNDYFIMPEKNITLRAIWSKPDISKTMDGTVHEKTTLYKTVKDDFLNNNGSTAYSGQSNDGGGNETIYYYTNSNNNYVSFAGLCWKIIRTTDTGGVKMQLAGGIDEDGACSTSINRVGYDGISTINIGNNQYVYGTNYDFNSNTGEFNLSGELNTYSWKTQSADIIGKYTCASDNQLSTCTELSYIESYLDTNNANRIIYHSVQTGIGSSIFNTNSKSLSSVGYMYNTEYNYDVKNMNNGKIDVLYSNIFEPNFYVATNYSYDDTNYKLTNPYLVSSNDYDNKNLSDLIGKYTLRSSDTNNEATSIYYIVAVEENTIYYLQISGGQDLTESAIDIYYADNIVNNGNGTYSLSGKISQINKLNWYNNHADINGKYTCNNNSKTCSNPYYVYNPTKNNFTYEDGKRNYIYGNGFEYDAINDEYTLKDTVNFNDFVNNYNRLGNHHYTCFNTTGKCQTLSYIYYIKDSKTPMFINLTNGDSILDAINNMLYDNNVNLYSSNMKALTERWFQEFLTNYESYLEDIVYCNDRTISNLGGWNPDGNAITWEDSNVSLEFNGFNYMNSKNPTIANTSLYCSNQLDRFSKSSKIGNGKLTYPIGYLTTAEALLTFDSQSNIEQIYLTPITFDVYGAKTSILTLNPKKISYYSVLGNKFMIPVISLKPGIEHISGNGSQNSPYYIPTDFN